MNTYKLVFSILIKKEKRKVFLSFLFSLLSMFLENLGLASFFPFLTLLLSDNKRISNSYLASLLEWLDKVDFLPPLLTGAVLIILLFMFKTLMKRQFTVFNIKLTEGIKARISSELLSKYIKSPYSFHIERSTPNILRSITTDIVSFDAYIKTALNILTQLILTIGISIFLLYVDFSMFLTIFLLLGLGTWGVITYAKRNMGFLGAEIRRLQKDITQNTLTSLGGIKEAKILNREDSFIKIHNMQAQKLSKARVYSSIKPALTKDLLELIVVSLTVAIVALMVYQGRESQGILTKISVFGVASFKLLPSISSLTRDISTLKTFQTAIISVYKDLTSLKIETEDNDIDHIQTEKKVSFQQNIRVVNAFFQYPNSPENVYAIKNLTISIPKNKCIGFVGGSGAGKTTLIDIILGLITPQQGGIYVDDTLLVAHKNVRSWQNMIGYIPQSIFLGDMSIKENIAFGLPKNSISEERIIESLKVAQLYDFVKELPKGIETYIGEGGVKLSGGQRQRVGIARALYKNPSVLLMDEATSALDNKTEKVFSESVNAIAGTKTIIIVAHRLSTVKNCDLLYVLKDGKVVSTGTYKDLEENDPHFQELIV